VEALGASEDAEDELVELRGGAQQHAPLDGTAGDLDEGTAFGDEAQVATHAPEKVGNRGAILALLPKLSSRLANFRRVSDPAAITAGFSSARRPPR